MTEERLMSRFPALRELGPAERSELLERARHRVFLDWRVWVMVACALGTPIVAGGMVLWAGEMWGLFAWLQVHTETSSDTWAGNLFTATILVTFVTATYIGIRFEQMVTDAAIHGELLARFQESTPKEASSPSAVSASPREDERPEEGEPH